MNIYDALSKDHRHFEVLLDRLVATSKADNDQWKSILDELRRDVIAHAHAEEAVFYNPLRELDQGKDLVMHSYGEHAMAETEIRALGAAKMVDANWTSMVEKLNKDLRHHIQEEESRVYGAARQIFSEQEAQQLGVAFERMKVETLKDADSVLESTIDLIANLLPTRLAGSFRKSLAKGSKKAA